MRLNSGNSDPFGGADDDAFADMLQGQAPLHEMKPQHSIGAASIFGYDHPRVGDTGTTPRMDYPSNFLMMNRSHNISVESRNDPAQLISPINRGNSVI